MPQIGLGPQESDQMVVKPETGGECVEAERACISPREDPATYISNEEGECLETRKFGKCICDDSQIHVNVVGEGEVSNAISQSRVIAEFEAKVHDVPPGGTRVSVECLKGQSVD